METRVATIPSVNAARAPDRVALVDGELQVTHAELAELCARIGAGLAAAGLRRADRLAILLENRLEFPAVFYAAIGAGIVAVPLNYRLVAAEIGHILAASSPKAIVADAKFAASLAPALAEAGSLEQVFWVGDTEEPGRRYEELLDHGAAPAAEPPGEEELLALFFTGGTTGRPKGVMLTHGALDLSVASESEALGFRETDVTLCAIPLFHVSIVHYLSVAWAGGSTVLMGKVDPAGVVAAIERHRVTHTTLIPTTIGDLLSDPATADADLSSVRLLAYGGAPIPLETLKRTIARIGSVLVQNYGLTEAAGVVTALMPADHRLDAPELMESVGRPLPHLTVEIRDPESDRPLPDGEIGELVVRGPSLMRGYWEDPEQTSLALADGGLRTGDLARIEDGWVFLHGRSKEMVISGGENVFPAEIESVIDRHPDVIEVAVIGIPHPRWGEAVKAFVVLAPGSELTPSKLIAHCRSALAGYKTPKEVAIRESLPRTGVGKIDKPALRRKEADG